MPPYRYFLHSWPRLCWLAFHGRQCFGVVVCKQDDHKGMLRGYIAMLVVKPAYRGLGVGEEAISPVHDFWLPKTPLLLLATSYGQIINTNA